MAAGFRIADERNARGWSQQYLADRLTQLGYTISQSGVDRMEKRDTKRPKCTQELCRIFGVTETWLLKGKEPKVAASLPADILDLVAALEGLPPSARAIVLATAMSQIKIMKQQDATDHPEYRPVSSRTQ